MGVFPWCSQISLISTDLKRTDTNSTLNQIRHSKTFTVNRLASFEPDNHRLQDHLKLCKAEPLSFLGLLRIPTTAKLIGRKHRFTSWISRKLCLFGHVERTRLSWSSAIRSGVRRDESQEMAVSIDSLYVGALHEREGLG